MYPAHLFTSLVIYFQPPQEQIALDLLASPEKL